jgi:hypothetical protein
LLIKNFIGDPFANFSTDLESAYQKKNYAFVDTPIGKNAIEG